MGKLLTMFSDRRGICCTLLSAPGAEWTPAGACAAAPPVASAVGEAPGAAAAGAVEGACRRPHVPFCGTLAYGEGMATGCCCC